MPKPKPTQVIRHEIVFGRKESAMLDSAMSAYTFNKIATPAVNLMNDVTGMYVFVNLIELFTKYDVPFIPTAPEGAELFKRLCKKWPHISNKTQISLKVKIGRLRKTLAEFCITYEIQIGTLRTFLGML